MSVLLDYLLKLIIRRLNSPLIFFPVTFKKLKTISLVKDFDDYRARMIEVILSKNNLVMKRLWNLDTNTYDAGALDKKTKEMLGLVVRRPADAPL